MTRARDKATDLAVLEVLLELVDVFFDFQIGSFSQSIIIRVRHFQKLNAVLS